MFVYILAVICLVYLCYDALFKNLLHNKKVQFFKTNNNRFFSYNLSHYFSFSHLKNEICFLPDVVLLC